MTFIHSPMVWLGLSPPLRVVSDPPLLAACHPFASLEEPPWAQPGCVPPPQGRADPTDAPKDSASRPGGHLGAPGPAGRVGRALDGRVSATVSSHPQDTKMGRERTQTPWRNH